MTEDFIDVGVQSLNLSRFEILDSWCTTGNSGVHWQKLRHSSVLLLFHMVSTGYLSLWEDGMDFVDEHWRVMFPDTAKHRKVMPVDHPAFKVTPTTIYRKFQVP